MTIPALLVLSLGNPAPYSQTLHSAGHIALGSLQRHLTRIWHKELGDSVYNPGGYRGTPLVPNAQRKVQREVPSDIFSPDSLPFLTPTKPVVPATITSHTRPQKGVKSKPHSIHLAPGPGILSPQPEFKLWQTRASPTHFFSHSPRFRLHQSPKLMNISGTFAHVLYHETLRVMNESFQRPCHRHLIMPCPLVVVHDDLELPLGVVRERDWSSSSKGHNGIKSCQHKMGKVPPHMWYRISIGIGRPKERTGDAVSEWVLRQLTDEEGRVLKNIGPEVYKILEGIEKKVKMRISGLTVPPLEGEENAQ